MNSSHQNPPGPHVEAETPDSAQATPCGPSPEPQPAAERQMDAQPEPAARPPAESAAAEPDQPPPDAASPDGASPDGASPDEAPPDAASIIAQLKEQAETMRDQMLRALAEAENTRRRAERDRQDIAKYALTDFARDLLSPADNLRRALDAVPAESVGQDAVLTNLNDGVAATERELMSALEKIGVKKIESLDQKFDPNFHQAMFEVPDSGKPPGIIVQVIQEGFLIHDRLLRPALVGVAKSEPAQKVDTTA